MIRPTPPSPEGPGKRKKSKAAKPSKAAKAPKASKAAKYSHLPKEGKVMEALVTPGDMERILEMLRDKELLDWLDRCAGEISLKGGKIVLHFGGGNASARAVLANAMMSLRDLVF
jgi:hypothetical protein